MFFETCYQKMNWKKMTYKALLAYNKVFKKNELWNTNRVKAGN